MSGQETKKVAEAFESNFVAPLGPQLDEFEAEVSRLMGGLHCVGLSSGSAALHLALRIAGVGPRDEVWVSSMTFAGGVFPINYLGATPKFFDLSPESWTIDVDLVEAELARGAKKPKAIVPTDLYGQSVHIERLEALAAQYEIPLIVDSAESLGAYAGDRPAASGGDAAILSFNGNKIITTSGGGMLVTKHKAWAERARFLSAQARDSAPHYEHSTFGYNYRLSNICAAIGVGQLKVLEDRVAARRQVFERYQQALPLTFMPEPEGFRSTRWLSVVLFDSYEQREQVREKLLAESIEARPIWKPMHLQPLYAGCQYVGAGFDEAIFERGLCLPSGSDLTIHEQNEVIERIQEVLDRG